ncbi:sigma-70 family RNA polymerase sigma factor [Bdellovibrio sp. HCB337]|uniref:sigma-70 family RNA polymerase sigma factor n=1 Tax=Bdellovibrio sp. HCB337 TaxID=3394358 RepID=UPI0039A44ED6
MSLKGTIDKIKNGDTEAFTGLVKQYQNLAFAYAFSMLKDFHRAQDAAQEAFIVAYYQVSQLQDPEAFPGWLKGIVRNQCHRQLRGKMNRWESLETLEDNAGEEPRPDQLLSLKEQSQVVLQAVQSLPERQREVVSLYYIEENSQQDVATFLEMSLSDVNNCLHAARKTLRGRMESMVDQTFKSKALSKDFVEGIGKIIKVRGRLVDAEMDPSFNPVLFDDLKAGKKAESKLTVVQRLKNGLVRCLVHGDSKGLKSDLKVQNEAAKSYSTADEASIKEVVSTIGTPSGKKLEIFETGIKIIDLLCPLPKNGNIGIMGSSGAGRSAVVAEMYKKFLQADGKISLFFFVGPNEASSVSTMIEHEPDLSVDEGGPMQTAWLITDQAAKPEFAKAADYLEARPFFNIEMAVQKRFPAVDPLRSHSRLLDPSIVSNDHYQTAIQVRELLANEGTLNELQASRARKLKNFFTQPFFVMANSTKVPGVSVGLKETITTCQKILAGDMDEVAEEMFLYTGGLPKQTRQIL